MFFDGVEGRECDFSKWPYRDTFAFQMHPGTGRV